MPLIDPHGRRIDYMRLSVTDRCNLRCSYCMPATGVISHGQDEILSYERLLLIARAAVDLGVEKIRVTGGEPLVRRGVIGFLRRLAAIPGLKRLVLTTNGILLPEMAQDLRDSGVESLNISIDSLRPGTFTAITRGGELHRVLEGLKAVERAGFPFVKINVVLMRGVNDEEIIEFASLTIDRPYRVRFIEYMPAVKDAGWERLSISGDEVLQVLSRQFDLVPVERERMAGPAQYVRLSGAKGMVGVITPISCHFCGDCNRIRVSATGKARSCLFGEGTLDLRPFLDGSQEDLKRALIRVVEDKPERHDLATSGRRPVMTMSRIGG